MKEGLRQSMGLVRRNAGVLLHPPGASPYLALMIAVAGFEVGLNAPSVIAETLAVRTLGREGISAFVSAVQGLPEPSRPAVTSALLLLALCLFTLGGWIRTADALVKGRTPKAEDWNTGVLHSGRAIFWIGAIALLAFALLAGTALLAAASARAWLAGTLGDGWTSMVWPMASGGLFMLALVASLYLLSTGAIMGVVAVVEPETRFFRIPARSRSVFKAGDGWDYFGKMGTLILAWFAAKLALLQLTIPFQPVGAPWGRLIAILGSVLHGALMFGDGLVALVGIVLAVQMYQRGAKRA